MKTLTNSNSSEALWFARFCGVGNVNANNARGKGNRAARRAGWYVRPTGGPAAQRELRELAASV